MNWRGFAGAALDAAGAIFTGLGMAAAWPFLRAADAIARAKRRLR